MSPSTYGLGRAHGCDRPTGKVIDEITADQRKYYGFQRDTFTAPPPGGRVMVLLSCP